MPKDKKPKNASPLEGPVKKKQTEIPGTEKKVIPEIEQKLLVYRKHRDEKLRLQKLVAQDKAELIALYKKHGIKHHPLVDGEDEYDGEFEQTETFKLNKVTEG
jgi:hypothetical protein